MSLEEAINRRRAKYASEQSRLKDNHKVIDLTGLDNIQKQQQRQRPGAAAVTAGSKTLNATVGSMNNQSTFDVIPEDKGDGSLDYLQDEYPSMTRCGTDLQTNS